MEQKILSLKDDKIISEVELFEYPAELRGWRNIITNKSVMQSWNGVRNVNTATGAFVYTPIPFRNALYQIEARAISEAMVGTVFGWQFESKLRGETIELTNDWQKAYVFGEITGGAIGLRCLKAGTIELRFIKAVEHINHTVNYTPAPEDLNLSYPDFITEFKPSISDRYILTEELIEYPEELIGGRNLIKDITHNYNTSNTVVTKVGDNELLLEFRKDSSSTPYVFIGQVDVVEGLPHFISCDILASSDDLELCNVTIGIRKGGGDIRKNIPTNSWQRFEGFTIKTESGVGRVIIFSSSYRQGISFRIKNMKISYSETVSPYTPAPEDLGLSCPDHIQSFGTSFSNNILINEFTEQ